MDEMVEMAREVVDERVGREGRRVEGQGSRGRNCEVLALVRFVTVPADAGAARMVKGRLRTSESRARCTVAMRARGWRSRGRLWRAEGDHRTGYLWVPKPG
eukprot:16430856-Heterocapsa_arctica.AAC.1